MTLVPREHAQPSAANNPVAIWLSKLTPGSRRTMLAALRNLVAIMTDQVIDPVDFQWSGLRYQHTTVIRARLTEVGYTAATINRHLSALRGVLKECWRLGQMTSEEYHRAIDVPGIEESRLPAGRMLVETELRRLLQVCDLDTHRGKVSGIRDSAIIAVMVITGMRREEVIHLNLTDVNIHTGEIQIRVAKRNRQRTSYVKGRALRRLADWLDARKDMGCEALFLTVDRNGNLRNQGIQHAQTIYDMLRRRAVQAGIENFSPHDLRRTAISNLLDEVDMSTVANIVGHASVETTRRYDRRGERTKEAAAELVDTPI
jgi:integrase